MLGRRIKIPGDIRGRAGIVQSSGHVREYVVQRTRQLPVRPLAVHRKEGVDKPAIAIRPPLGGAQVLEQ